MFGELFENMKNLSERFNIMESVWLEVQNKISLMSQEELSNYINELTDELAHEQRFSGGGSHIFQMEQQLDKIQKFYNQKFDVDLEEQKPSHTDTMKQIPPEEENYNEEEGDYPE